MNTKNSPKVSNEHSNFVPQVITIHAFPTVGKTTFMKALRADGFNVIDTDDLFFMLDPEHFSKKVWRDKNTSYDWTWLYDHLDNLISSIHDASMTIAHLDERTRSKNHTLVLTNLWHGKNLAHSYIVPPQVITARSTARGSVIPLEVATMWKESYDAKFSESFPDVPITELTADQFLSDFLDDVKTLLSSPLSDASETSKNVTEETSKWNESNFRVMTDDLKDAALNKGNVPAKLSWITEELLEFTFAPDETEKLSELTDVIACFVRLELPIALVLDFWTAEGLMKQFESLHSTLVSLESHTLRLLIQDLNLRQAKRGRPVISTSAIVQVAHSLVAIKVHGSI